VGAAFHRRFGEKPERFGVQSTLPRFTSAVTAASGSIAARPEISRRASCKWDEPPKNKGAFYVGRHACCIAEID
jgi:hypothetical protein